MTIGELQPPKHRRVGEESEAAYKPHTAGPLQPNRDYLLCPHATFAINPGIDQLDIIRKSWPRESFPEGRGNGTTSRM